MLTLNGSLDIILMEIFLLFSFILINIVFSIYLFKNKTEIKASFGNLKATYLWNLVLLFTFIFIIWLIICLVFVFITVKVLGVPYYETGRVLIGSSIIIAIILSIIYVQKNDFKNSIFMIIPLLLSLIFFSTSQLVIDYYKLMSYAISEQDIWAEYDENFLLSQQDQTKKHVLVMGIDGIPFNWFYNLQTYPILFDQGTAPNQKTIFNYQYHFYSPGAYESTQGWTSLLTGSNNTTTREKNIFELIHENPQLTDKIRQSSLVQWPWINANIVNNDDSFVHKKNTNLTADWSVYDGIVGNYNTTKDIIHDINNDYHFIFSQYVLGDDLNHLRYPIYSRYLVNENLDINQKIMMLEKLIAQRTQDFNEQWLIIFTTDHGRNNDTYDYDHSDNYWSHQSFFVANQNLTNILGTAPDSQYNLKSIILNYLQ